MYLVAGSGYRSIQEPAVALDLNWDYLQRSRAASHKQVMYVLADLRAVPFRDGVFLRINNWDVLEHIQEKQVVVAELARVAACDAAIEISASPKAANELLGRLSRTYQRMITSDSHKWAVSSREYIDLIGRHFTVRRIVYPCAAPIFLVALLLDPFRVTIGPGEDDWFIGPNANLVLRIAYNLAPFVQILFNRLARHYYEQLSQGVAIYAVKSRASGGHQPHVEYGTPVNLGAYLSTKLRRLLRRMPSNKKRNMANP